jgi:uncharacterized protein YjiS (DUF1127 family)
MLNESALDQPETAALCGALGPPPITVQEPSAMETIQPRHETGAWESTGEPVDPAMSAAPVVRRTAAGEPGAGGWRGMWHDAWARIAQWRVLHAQRSQLARLDDRMLKDIGLTRVDAHQETRKWFWRV